MWLLTPRERDWDRDREQGRERERERIREKARKERKKWRKRCWDYGMRSKGECHRIMQWRSKINLSPRFKQRSQCKSVPCYCPVSPLYGDVPFFLFLLFYSCLWTLSIVFLSRIRHVYNFSSFPSALCMFLTISHFTWNFQPCCVLSCVPQKDRDLICGLKVMQHASACMCSSSHVVHYSHLLC